MSDAIRVILAPPRRDSHQGRAGFTLVELLVAILVIAILSAFVYGALARAGNSAKIVHTKSTIAKLNASLMDRWDSYRSRRIPVSPKQLFASASQQGINARAFANYLWQKRGSLTNDPLNTQPANAAGIPYPSSAQVAATRLACIREMMQFEMPATFSDFIWNFDNTTTPGNYTIRTPYVLPSAPPIANTYLAAVNIAANKTGATFEQIQENESAECLYLILTVGSTDNGLFGEQLPTRDVGDVDGDGLLEFQDSWAVSSNSYQPKGQANAPIRFIRWAPGYVSSIQDNPFFPTMNEFSLSHHDYYDPLKLDIPDATTPTPRGYQLFPLIYSAGPDGSWGLWQQPIVASQTMALSDPYDSSNATNGHWAGTPDTVNSSPGADGDNITNHELDTRTGK